MIIFYLDLIPKTERFHSMHKAALCNYLMFENLNTLQKTLKNEHFPVSKCGRIKCGSHIVSTLRECNKNSICMEVNYISI